MSQIKAILRRYVPEVALGSSKKEAKTEIDRRRLQADLRGVAARNQVYFNVAIAMPLVSFIGLLLAVLTHVNHPEWVQALSIATGVSFLGMIKITASLWKTKVTAEMVGALAGSLPEDALKAAIGSLLGKM